MDKFSTEHYHGFIIVSPLSRYEAPLPELIKLVEFLISIMTSLVIARNLILLNLSVPVTNLKSLIPDVLLETQSIIVITINVAFI